MDVLERILNVKRAELEAEKGQLPMRRAIEMASAAPPPRDFPAAVRRPGSVNVIAEVKRASPSRGNIPANADPDVVARSYEAAPQRSRFSQTPNSSSVHPSTSRLSAKPSPFLSCARTSYSTSIRSTGAGRSARTRFC
jgi:hypothetical protein